MISFRQRVASGISVCQDRLTMLLLTACLFWLGAVVVATEELQGFILKVFTLTVA